MAEDTIMLGYIKVITLRPYRINGNLLLKRFRKMRRSDKRKRIDQEIRKLRKMWWHFKTRWEA
jgi:hypothetical protein